MKHGHKSIISKKQKLELIVIWIAFSWIASILCLKMYLFSQTLVRPKNESLGEIIISNDHTKYQIVFVLQYGCNIINTHKYKYKYIDLKWSNEKQNSLYLSIFT